MALRLLSRKSVALHLQHYLKPKHKHFGLLGSISGTIINHGHTQIYHYCSISSPVPPTLFTTVRYPVGPVCPDGTTGYTSSVSPQDLHRLEPLAQFAINVHNQQNQKEKLEFVRVVSACHQRVAGQKYTIKIEANAGFDEPVFYAAVIWMRRWLKHVEVLNWDRVDAQISAFRHSLNLREKEWSRRRGVTNIHP